MAVIEEILVPKENVSDDAYIVVDLPVKSGSQVTPGTTLFVLESSKATVEVECTSNGTIHYIVEQQQAILVGTAIGFVTDEEELPENLQKKLRAGIRRRSENGASDPGIAIGGTDLTRFSKGALELVKANNIPFEIFASLPLVRGKDVIAFLGKGTVVKPGSASTAGANRIVIVGGGGHAKMCLDILKANRDFNIVGITDPNLARGDEVLGVPVIGDDTELEKLYSDGVRFAVNGIGGVAEPAFRQKFFNMLKEIGFILPNLIHRSSIVEASVELGEGNQVMAGAILGSNVVVGDNCIINSGAIVSHDTVLSNHVHVAPGAIIGGSVQVGQRCLIGMGAKIYFGLNIGDECIVTNGVNVFEDQPAKTILKN